MRSMNGEEVTGIDRGKHLLPCRTCEQVQTFNLKEKGLAIHRAECRSRIVGASQILSNAAMEDA